MIFPTIMALLYFVALAGEPSKPRPDANLAVVIAYGAGKVIQFAFPLVFVLLYERQMLQLTGPTLGGIAFGLGYGVLVAGVILLLYHLRLHQELVKAGAPAKIEAKLVQFGLNSPAGFLLLAVFLCLIHSLFEEYYWRWFVFGQLRRCIPVGAAILLSGLAFMAHHVVVLTQFFQGAHQFSTKVVPFSLGIAVGGMIWSWLYYRTGSLYAPWLSHLLIDAAVMVVGYDMVFGG
jgi:membrane protease YdiL (CAAX protease family)